MGSFKRNRRAVSVGKEEDVFNQNEIDTPKLDSFKVDSNLRHIACRIHLRRLDVL